MTVSSREHARPTKPRSRPAPLEAATTIDATVVHPVAWWIWALGLAGAANRTTNPVLLALLLVVAGYVVTTCRSRQSWAAGHSRGFTTFLKLGLTVLAIRTVFHMVFGSIAGGTVVLFRLPEMPLPGWATGIRLGGPVYAEGLIGTAYDAFRLAVMLCCIGAAVALAEPRRLLASLPGALYEVGVAVVVGMSLAPEIIVGAGRVRKARELRGDPLAGGGNPIRRAHAFARIALPVLADATDRALVLAASMDARGYGRTATVPRRIQLTTGALVLTGLCGLALGAYGVLDTTTPTWVTVLALVAGLVCSTGGLLLGSHRVARTRVSANRWTPRSLLVVQAGLWALVGSFVAGWRGEPLDPPDVLSWPPLPVVAFVTATLAVLPALLPRRVR